MRKSIIAVVLFGLLGAVHSFAQGQDFSKVEMKVQKVSGSVYMIEGAGGNIGASVGEDGIVMVDDEFLPLADKIEAALKGITDKPVKVVLNTHWHGEPVDREINRRVLFWSYTRCLDLRCRRQCASRRSRALSRLWKARENHHPPCC